MKKFALMISLSILALVSHQCRTSNDMIPEDQELSTPLSPTIQRLTKDSVSSREILTDPPVRDGHDWRSGRL